MSGGDWRIWLERHGGALQLFAAQWAHGRAEDAVQEGFVRFWKNRDRAGDRVAYLYACVRTAALDLQRGEQRRMLREQAAGRSEATFFECPAEHAELRSAVEAALAQLPEEQREVVVMKVWGGLTFAQIAEALHLSLNTATSRYRYGMQKLETLLGREVKS